MKSTSGIQEHVLPRLGKHPILFEVIQDKVQRRETEYDLLSMKMYQLLEKDTYVTNFKEPYCFLANNTWENT